MTNGELKQIIAELSKEKKIVLLSIQPHFSRLIFSGKKTIELRKRLPKHLGRFIVVYESTPTKLIMGVLRIRKTEIKRKQELLRLLSKAKVTKVFFDRYYEGNEMGAYYEIEKAFQFEQKIPLTELKRLNFSVPQDFRYLNPQIIGALFG
jgi:predicted transcriptional regulator